MAISNRRDHSAGVFPILQRCRSFHLCSVRNRCGRSLSSLPSGVGQNRGPAPPAGSLLCGLGQIFVVGILGGSCARDDFLDS
jgi:hypothetical protein